jgi:hypothetical protein
MRSDALRARVLDAVLVWIMRLLPVLATVTNVWHQVLGWVHIHADELTPKYYRWEYTIKHKKRTLEVRLAEPHTAVLMGEQNCAQSVSRTALERTWLEGHWGYSRKRHESARNVKNDGAGVLWLGSNVGELKTIEETGESRSKGFAWNAMQ